MKVLLKFHPTLTGGVDENIKKTKTFKTEYDQYFYISKQTTFADILEKFHPTLTGWVDVSKSLFNFKISHAWEDIDK